MSGPGMQWRAVRPLGSAAHVLATDELLVAILEQADQCTLKASSLCCRRWRELARGPLWRSIWLSTRPSDTGCKWTFLQRALAHFEGGEYLGLESLGAIQTLAGRFLGQFPDTLGHVRHIRLDLAMPYDRTESSRDVTHFLGQVLAAGNVISACVRLRSLDVHVRLAHRSAGPRVPIQVVPMHAAGPAAAEQQGDAEAAQQDPNAGAVVVHEDHAEVMAAAAEPTAAASAASVPGVIAIDGAAYGSDILDDADEEAVSINASRMLVPAIRMLEVVLRRGSFATPLRIGWSIDFAFARPARLIPTAGR
ncbi:hypothetical protein HK105_208714 [Polyrhizophydium stewartii]|uniref:F-box domain-containing protein n=1 Tax=Polyrhizophydium stewartii TaxID=2732419 RepID=A0ABR4MX11_9FUNG